MRDYDEYEDDQVDIDLELENDVEVEEEVIDLPPEKRRKNKKGEVSDDYVDNQKLYDNIKDWQNSANDFAVRYEHQIQQFYPDRKDGNSFEKALTSAIAAKVIPNEPKISDEIGVSILHICTKFSQKPNWRGYSWREEMVDDAVIDCVRGIRKFNSTSYTNPFAYFTQVAHWAFTGRIVKEKQEHERKLAMAFDPTNEAAYTTLDGDKTVYNVGVNDTFDFYYANKD